MQPPADAGSPPPGAAAPARRCLRAWVAAAGLLALLTFLANARPGTLGVWLRPFDLGTEANAAAWFSACSLLWSGLLMASAAVALWRADRAAAAAAGFLGLVAAALFVDEAGSLHERFDLLVPAALGLSLKKVAALGAVPVAAALGALFTRRRTLGPAWAQLAGAYLLFGSVFAQELLEHAVAWPPALLPLRMLVEEGSELCGFFLLLLAATGLRERTLARPGGARTAGRWEAVLPARAVLVCASVAAAALAPALIALSLSIPFPVLSLANRGNFASTMPVALFLLAGAVCLRRAVAGAGGAGGSGGAGGAGGVGRGWGWVGLGCVGLSLLQNWHAYDDASVLLLGRPAAHPWRACYDVAWSLPLFMALLFAFRRRLRRVGWVLPFLGLGWAACVVAAWRASFPLSYAASWWSAAATAAWAVAATRGPAGSTRTP